MDNQKLMVTKPAPHPEKKEDHLCDLQVPFHRAPVGEEEAQAVSEIIRSG